MRCRICLQEIADGPEQDPVIQQLMESGALGGPSLDLVDAVHTWCQAAEAAARLARPAPPASPTRPSRKDTTPHGL